MASILLYFPKFRFFIFLHGTRSASRHPNSECVRYQSRTGHFDSLKRALHTTLLRGRPLLPASKAVCYMAHDKKFFFKILASILPEFYQRVLETIKANREAMIPEAQKIEVIPEMQTLIRRNTSYFGPHAKVGHFLSSGRRWTTPTRTVCQPIEIRNLF